MGPIVAWQQRLREVGKLTLLPLSREEGQLQALLRSVVAYRLAFGQPRQDDLVAWLGDRMAGDAGSDDRIARLRVDLSPPPG